MLSFETEFLKYRNRELNFGTVEFELLLKNMLNFLKVSFNVK